MYVFQHANSQNTHYVQKNSAFLGYVKMGPFPSILKNGGGGLERICSALGKIGLLGLMAELDISCTQNCYKKSQPSDLNGTNKTVDVCGEGLRSVCLL